MFFAQIKERGDGIPGVAPQAGIILPVALLPAVFLRAAAHPVKIRPAALAEL